MSSEKAPLEGLKVVTIESFGVVPFATRMLSEWGADVIRINTAAIDAEREFFPDQDLSSARGRWNIFDAKNFGKLILDLNLKDPAGRNAMAGLVDWADVLVTNVRPMSRPALGIEWTELHNRNPNLVYVTMTGYGEKGPDSNKAGFDAVAFWAASGMMSIFGEPASPPVASRPGIGDLATSIAVCNAVLAGVTSRTLRGYGVHVSVSQMHTAIWVESMAMYLWLNGRAPVRPVGRANGRQPLINIYRCADDVWIYLCVLGPGEQDAWRQLCAIVARDDLVTDQRFTDRDSRHENSRELIRILDESFGTRPGSAWREAFERASFPYWSPIATLEEAEASPQTSANKWILPEEGDRAPVIRAPATFADYDDRVLEKRTASAPLSRAALAACSLPEEVIAALEASGAFIAQ